MPDLSQLADMLIDLVINALEWLQAHSIVSDWLPMALFLCGFVFLAAAWDVIARVVALRRSGRL